MVIIYYSIVFKSDRCGIETARLGLCACPAYCVQIRPLRDWNRAIGSVCMSSILRSNQTVAGLKLWIRYDHHVVTVGSNQTVAGLKLICERSDYAVRFCSNQTVAGLKLFLLYSHLQPNRCSNQTVAGLKLIPLISISSFFDPFKSDRCGIETLQERR